MIKKVAILGSTGSIGKQALEVISSKPENFEVVALAAGIRWEVLLEQIRLYRPKIVSVTKASDALLLEENLKTMKKKPEIFWGDKGLEEVATFSGSQVVLTAITGTAGLSPTISAIKAGKDIALANKETLVVAGNLVSQLAIERKVAILPVDSEHGAIWQCLQGKKNSQEKFSSLLGIDLSDLDKLILTASGGPFRLEPKDLSLVTVEMSLKHPNWSMGSKITIDSATYMNKGLEVIEAHWLFGVDYSQIEVVVHPQSIIHSMVQFIDGSVLAQMGLPDMRLPIQYALYYPNRLKSDWPKINWNKLKDLSFESPDLRRFPLLSLAYEAGKAKGTMAVALNASNEIAVEAFLKGKIKFTDIFKLVSLMLEKHNSISNPSLEDILGIDKEVRREALVKLNQYL